MADDRPHPLKVLMERELMRHAQVAILALESILLATYANPSITQQERDQIIDEFWMDLRKQVMVGVAEKGNSFLLIQREMNEGKIDILTAAARMSRIMRGNS
jgi:hypothetical protein